MSPETGRLRSRGQEVTRTRAGQCAHLREAGESDGWRVRLACLCGRTSMSRGRQQVSGMLLLAQTVLTTPPAAEHHMFHEGRSTCTGKQPTLDPRGLWCSQKCKTHPAQHLPPQSCRSQSQHHSKDHRLVDATDQYAPASERRRQQGHRGLKPLLRCTLLREPLQNQEAT